MKYPKRDRMCSMVADSELHTVELALKHVKNFRNCIQAGGNVGYWPKYLSTKFDTVYTFEPDEENYDCLQLNVGEDNVIKQRAALGECYSRGKVVGSPTNCGAYQVEDGDDFDVIAIDSLEIDNVDFVCLDIEGLELQAIKGAIDTIKTYSPVIMIEDKGCSEKYGYKKGDVAIFLESFGYKVVEELPRDVILARP